MTRRDEAHVGINRSLLAAGLVVHIGFSSNVIGIWVSPSTEATFSDYLLDDAKAVTFFRAVQLLFHEGSKQQTVGMLYLFLSRHS